MSTLSVDVIEVDDIKAHPNADALEIAVIGGTQTIVRKGTFVAGDPGVYFPPDTLIPENRARELGVDNYLKHAIYPGDIFKTRCRVAACRLRGQPSYGFFLPLRDVFAHRDDYPPVGADCTNWFQAKKYEPPKRVRPEDIEEPHLLFHQYTDIEHYWRYPIIPEGTEVAITEKIHGTNSRIGLIKTADGEFEFMAGSHRTRRKQGGLFWEPLPRVMIALTDLCDEKHSVIFFGEIYGPGIQDMDYGVVEGDRGYAVFDISIDGKYLDFEQVVEVCLRYGLPHVPLVYLGPFEKDKLPRLTSATTFVGDPRCDFKGREGVVIKPTTETFSAILGGRLILKSVSCDYLDRKDAEDNE